MIALYAVVLAVTIVLYRRLPNRTNLTVEELSTTP